MKKFFADNKVFIIGLITSLCVVGQQYLDEKVADPFIVGFGVAGAIASYFAKNLRGQWGSIIGIGGNMIAVLTQAHITQQPINPWQLIIQAAVAYMGIIASPPKSRSYEKTDTIADAKQEAKEIDAAKKVSPPPPVQ